MGYTIYLNDIKFFAHHGLYEQEKINGNNFIVDAIIEMDDNKKIDTIENTINYEKVFSIIANRMKKPTELLETICFDICHTVIKKMSKAKMVQVKITKLNPPIKKYTGNVAVEYRLDRK